MIRGILLLLMAVVVIIGITACQSPLNITNIKVVDDLCGCICISWETNYDAICKVTYCEEGLCYTSELEPEYGVLHSYGIPSHNSSSITITAIGKDGTAISKEIP